MKLRLLPISSLFFSLGDNSLASPLSHIFLFSKECLSSFQIKDQTAVADLKKIPVTLLNNSNKKIFAEKQWMNRFFKSLAAFSGVRPGEGLVSASLYLIPKRQDFSAKCNKN